jgi:hypothetical protein
VAIKGLSREEGREAFCPECSPQTRFSSAGWWLCRVPPGHHMGHSLERSDTEGADLEGPGWIFKAIVNCVTAPFAQISHSSFTRLLAV